MATGASADALSPDETAALAQPQALTDIVIGRADAPATIVEYASLTCSHCAAFHKDVWPALKAKYVDTGQARFVLREFPIDGLAIVAFMLARCSGDDKRNAVVDWLFDHQADWAFAANPVAKLKEQLTAAGMSDADFEACLKNQALLDKVKAERDRAHGDLGVKATPTFFVGGQRLEGGQSLDTFDKILSPQAK
jgi:protein-disulfide isomerase